MADVNDTPRPLLALRRVAKTYGGVRALRGVDFEVRAGEVHVLLGENGAGKSTLIKIAAGAVAPDAGAEVKLMGERLAEASPRAVQERGLAVVYQNPTLFAELSVAENLCLGEEGAVISWRRRRAVARERLARVGAKIDVNAPAGSLRMAEQQLVEIARALGRRARVLILDEPTASLAQHEADNLLTLVERMRGDGVGVLYVSHRLEEVLRVGDRFTVLRDGAHVATLGRAEVNRERLIQLMAGRELAQMFPKTMVAAGEVLLETRGLSDAWTGLGEVSLRVRASEILGLAGLIGAGRTEFARVVCGLAPATAGEIWVDGRRVELRSVSDALAAGIAYLPEDRKRHGVIEELSIAENIGLAMLRRCGRWWVDERAERAVAGELAQRLAVKAASLDVPVRTLSGGNQQKVALARWLATKPRVLVLDEPTQGVDVGAKAEIHALIGELARAGVAIVLISSELPELLAMADRVAVFRGGRVVGEVVAREATRESVLALAMGETAA